METVFTLRRNGLKPNPISLSLDACLREAASAKAGVRVKYGKFYHPPLRPLPSREGTKYF
jgi:hypothetical protein